MSRRTGDETSYVSRLTTRQQTDLNEAILSYITQLGLKDVASVFAKEAKVKTSKKNPKALERKWKTVERLAEQIDTIEVQNNEFQDILERFKEGGRVDDTVRLPKVSDVTMDQHRGAITCVKFHPKFALLASSSKDGCVKIWDGDNGRFKKTVAGHTDSVETVTFNGAGTLMATGSVDSTIKMWNVDDEYKCVKTLTGHEHTVSALIFSHDGSMLFSASRDCSIKMWEVETGHLKKSFDGGGDFGHRDWIRTLSLSPDGGLLASAGKDKRISIWDLKTMEHRESLMDHDNTVTSIAFSNAAADQHIINSILEDEDQKAATAHKAKLEEKGEFTGGMFLVSASRDRTIRIWFLLEGVCVRIIKGHDNWVNSVCFQPSGQYIISGADDKTIRVWDLSKNARCCRKLVKAHASWVKTIDYNRAFPRLASGDMKNKIKLWKCV